MKEELASMSMDLSYRNVPFVMLFVASSHQKGLTRLRLTSTLSLSASTCSCPRGGFLACNNEWLGV